MFAALADQARAQLALVEDKLARAKVQAPFRGVVVSGDLSQMLGSPIEKGKTLFELAPLDAFASSCRWTNATSRMCSGGQAGQLVLTGFSNAVFPFESKL